MTAVNLNRAVRGPVTAVPIVAGKGVRLVADTENNRWVVEADETLLWSGKEADAGTIITLPELQTNFEYLVFGLSGVYNREPMDYKVKVQSTYTTTCEVVSMDGNYVFRWIVNLGGDSNDLTKISISRSTGIRTSLAGASPTSFTPATTGTYQCGLLYIKGVNRIASN